MKETILIAVISALTSGGVLGFIQFLIKRKDDKEQRAEDKEERQEDKEFDSIKETLKKLEKDGLRTQLLLLLLLMPEEKKEILTIAEHYFSKPPKGLGGNWYMTSLFDKWVVSHNDGLKPEWFKTEQSNEI